MRQKKSPSNRDTRGGADEADDRVAKLTSILRRLNEGVDPLTARHEAREFLGSVSPVDLSRAEQQLMQGGMAAEELRHLCAIHLEMVGQQTSQMTGDLDPQHVIHTLVIEHQAILGFLDELVEVNRAIQRLARYQDGSREFARLHSVAVHLLATEPHHRREEEVLFPELERQGITAPCQIIRAEHAEVRSREQELMDLSEGAAQMSFPELKTRLDIVVNVLVLTLRDHIINENGMLYPTALEVIEDRQVWERMREDSYRIGECCFASEA